MQQLGTLRATSCTSLQPLTAALVAACGPKTAYLLDALNGEERSSCTAPREATTYALWMPPGATAAADAVLLYGSASVRDDEGYCVRALLPRSSAAAAETVRLALPDAPAGRLLSVSVLFHTTLCVQTAREAAFYALDPAAVLTHAASSTDAVKERTCTLTHIGQCTLPAGCRWLLLEAAPESAGQSFKEIVMAAVGDTAMHVRVVYVTAGVRAAVERATPAEGLPLPAAKDAASVDDDGEPFRAARACWARRELLLLRGGVSATVLSVPLDGRTGDGRALGWAPRPGHEPDFVTAATRPVVSNASDLCCAEDGSVWVLDATTGPTVTLCAVTSPYLPVVELPGSSVSVRASAATQGPTLLVLTGRSLYAMNVSASGSSTNLQRSANGSAKAPQSTAPAKTSDALCDWLLHQQQQRQSGGAAAAGARDADAEVEVLATTLWGEGQTLKGVVRDGLFVRCPPSDAPLRLTHALLDALAAKAGSGKDAASQQRWDRALVRYAAVAQSLHPYSVFALLCHATDAAAPAARSRQNDALLLALSAVLAQKPSLSGDGALHRMAGCQDAVRAFVALLSTPLAQKRYVAALCRVGVTALATGALGAARLLFSAADLGVSVLYGGRERAEAERLQLSAEERALESDITAAVGVLSAYADWALSSAASSLGLMTAHVGTSRDLRKEALAPDGKSRPIRTSRAADVTPLQLQQRASIGVPLK